MPERDGDFVLPARLDEVEHLGVTEVDKTYAEANDMTAQQLIANVYVTAKYLMMGDWGVHYIATTSAKTAECWPGGVRARTTVPNITACRP